MAINEDFKILGTNILRLSWRQAVILLSIAVSLVFSSSSNVVFGQRVLEFEAHLRFIDPPNGFASSVYVYRSQNDSNTRVLGHIQVSTPSTSDRKYIARIRGNGRRDPTTHEITIPAGETEVVFFREISSDSYFFEMELVDDTGQEYRDQTYGNRDNVVKFPVLMVEDGPQSKLAAILPKGGDAGTTTLPQPIAGVPTQVQYGWQDNFTPSLFVSSLENLPIDSRRYQLFEFVVLKKEDLVKLTKMGSERTVALRSWVRFGGTVVVLDANDGDDAREIETLLNSLNFELTDGRSHSDGFFTEVVAPPTRRKLQASSEVAIEEYYIWQAGTGSVLALPTPSSVEDWRATFLSANESSSVMTGAAISQNDQLVGMQGVGEVPTMFFLFLISGYLVFVGPVGYAVLQRFKRLYLMLVLPPIVGVAVVVGFVTVLLISDGIIPRVRVDSFNVVDSKNELARHFSHQVRYSPLGYPGGIEFSNDLDVRQIQKTRGRYIVYSTEDQTNFRGTSIAPRGVPEFELYGDLRTDAGLIEIWREGKLVGFENRLGSHLRALFVKASDGSFFYFREVPMGVVEVTAAVEAPSLQTELDKLAPRDYSDIDSSFYGAINQQATRDPFRKFYDAVYCFEPMPSRAEFGSREFFAVAVDNPLSRFPKGYAKHESSREFVCGWTMKNQPALESSSKSSEGDSKTGANSEVAK